MSLNIDEGQSNVNTAWLLPLPPCSSYPDQQGSSEQRVVAGQQQIVLPKYQDVPPVSMS